MTRLKRTEAQAKQPFPATQVLLARALLITALTAAGVCFGLAGVTGCESDAHDARAAVGDPQQGKQLIAQYGCAACHIIPGIREARGLVGPPLFDFADRTMIAGELPNTAVNLERWLENPPGVEPRTAMPNVGLTAPQAQDIAAYLYTLRGRS
jgi:cytochrome c2